MLPKTPGCCPPPHLVKENFDALEAHVKLTCCCRAPFAMASDPPAMTCDAAISKLSAASNRDRCGEDILEACIALRDTRLKLDEANNQVAALEKALDR